MQGEICVLSLLFSLTKLIFRSIITLLEGVAGGFTVASQHIGL